MRIDPHVALVGSGWLGHSLSHPLDCNVYLVGGPERAVLVDAGCGLGTETLLANVERAGVRPEVIEHVLVTHAHPDHAAGAGALAAAVGADVLASPAVAQVLREADEEAAGLAAARRSGTYPPELVMTPTAVSAIGDGTSWELPGVRLQAVRTPGHAVGHLCFVLETERGRAVLTGDLVFARGRVAVLATPDTDVTALHASIRRVAAVAPDVLLPGHGELVLGDAGRHLDVALRALADEQLPPGLVT